MKIGKQKNLIIEHGNIGKQGYRKMGTVNGKTVEFENGKLGKMENRNFGKMDNWKT